LKADRCCREIRSKHGVHFIQTGVRDLRRRADRQRLRVVVWLRARSLQHAEIELGWLGWEQADFFDPEMEAEVDRIRVFEKEQAELVNAGADLADRIRETEEQREAAKQALEKTIADSETERAPLEAERATAAAAVRTKRDARGKFARHAEDLPRLQAALEMCYEELSFIEPKDAATLTDLARIREERARADRELREVQMSHGLLGDEIAALEQSIAELDQRLGVYYAAEREARSKFERIDAEHAERIGDAEQERAESAKEITALDSKKTDPYRRLGQCLADNNIPPRNQPDALLHVHELRSQIADAAEGIRRLSAESAAEDPAELTKFYALLALVILLLLVFLWLLARHA
jgi:chromosome segregation ATPase